MYEQVDIVTMVTGGIVEIFTRHVTQSSGSSPISLIML